MREIVFCTVGGCGTKCGLKFWEIIADEHGINNEGKYTGNSDLQLERMNVYFDEVVGGRFVPRSVNIDMDNKIKEVITNFPIHTLLRPDMIIHGNQGASNNYARGMYGEGSVLMDDAMDCIRKTVESCDLIQGFQIIHSIGGGCGSGMNSLLISNLKNDYSDRIVNSFTVIPSAKLSEIVVENYNALLSFDYLTEYSDSTVFLDNEALCSICQDVLKIVGTFQDFNHLISMCVGGLTTCFRFPGQLNSDLRKQCVNMIPFPRMHYFAPAFVPLVAKGSRAYQSIKVPTLIEQMFDAKYLMAACDPTKGKFLTCCAIIRGLTSMAEIEEGLYGTQLKNHPYFVNWIPNNIQKAVCDIPPRGMKLSATFLGNTTSVRRVFARIQKQFSAMLKRKAHIHWYTGEGMEENEFFNAESSVIDIINEYQGYETNDKDGVNVHEEDEVANF